MRSLSRVRLLSMSDTLHSYHYAKATGASAFGSMREELLDATRRAEVSLLHLLDADAEVTEALSPEELDACFDYSYHVRHAEHIFEQVGI